MPYWFSANSKNHKIPYILISPGAPVHRSRLRSNSPTEMVNISIFCYFVTNSFWKNESTQAGMNEKIIILPYNPLELRVTKCWCGWHLSYLCHLTMNALYKIAFIIVSYIRSIYYISVSYSGILEVLKHSELPEYNKILGNSQLSI